MRYLKFKTTNNKSVYVPGLWTPCTALLIYYVGQAKNKNGTKSFALIMNTSCTVLSCLYVDGRRVFLSPPAADRWC